MCCTVHHTVAPTLCILSSSLGRLRPIDMSGTTHIYHRQGDISIRSKDNVILWADSWRLADASVVFKDLLDLPQVVNRNGKRQQIENLINQCSAHRPDRQAIPVDYNADVIGTFLDLINVSIPFLPINLTNFKQVQGLFEMCDKFDVKTEIQVKVKERLLACSKDHPWALLIMASDRNDIPLAKEALRLMTASQFFGHQVNEPVLVSRAFRISRVDRGNETSQIPRPTNANASDNSPPVHLWTNMRQLRPDWQLCLLQLALIVPFPPRSFKGPVEVSDDWKYIASKFQPGTIMEPAIASQANQ
ncbi:hypothetical protein IAT40_000907 [Kwoniella sp. CBS 6097]